MLNNYPHLLYLKMALPNLFFFFGPILAELPASSFVAANEDLDDTVEGEELGDDSIVDEEVCASITPFSRGPCVPVCIVSCCIWLG